MASFSRNFGIVIAIITFTGWTWHGSLAQEKGSSALQEKDAPAKQEQKSDEAPAPQSVKLAKGSLELTAPGTWEKVEPKSSMIEVEMSIPMAEGDEAAGRLTIMSAGGTVEANIQRWIDQFAQPDGGNSKDKAKIEKKTIAEETVHLVDIAGTYLDSAPGGGPFGPKTERPGYRLLGAIIESESAGQYFVKLTGPQKTIEKNLEGFKSMIESLKVSD